MANLGFKVHVTKGELATIMGPTATGSPAYGRAKRLLRAGVLGDSGLDIIETLDEDTGIFLDNPAWAGMFDLLAATPAPDGQMIMYPPARVAIADYVTAQLAMPPEASPGVVAPASHRWRLPIGVDPSDWFTSDIWSEEPIGDGFLRVWSNGDCTHPDAVMEV